MGGLKSLGKKFKKATGIDLYPKKGGDFLGPLFTNDKVKAELTRAKQNYREYYDPIGFYKNQLETSEEEAQKAAADSLEEQKRNNEEMERYTQEQLALQEEMAAEEKANMELQRQELERQRKEREDKQAAADAVEAEENAKVKNRGRRRISLVKTEQQDENVLGNTTVGRKRVLAS